MALAPSSLILWTGPKHSGKTTAATRLVQMARARGYAVAGFLAPSIYANGSLVGFDLLDLRSLQRVPLARRTVDKGTYEPFEFMEEGLARGNAALRAETAGDADLIVIDEFGPLELNSRGWRPATDRLMNSTRAPLLLVVREGLTDRVRQLYGGIPTRVLASANHDSIDNVLATVRNTRGSSSYQDEAGNPVPVR